jgi:hypothetical protein
MSAYGVGFSRALGHHFLSMTANFGRKELNQGAVGVIEIAKFQERVLEAAKLQEIVALLANLRDAAHQLPEGTERQNALREIRGYQIRIAAFVRRLGVQ